MGIRRLRPGWCARCQLVQVGLLRARLHGVVLHLVRASTLSIRMIILTSIPFRFVLLGHGPRSTFAAGGVVRSGYVRSSGFLSFLLLLYPIAWGLSEGGNLLSPNGEMIFYGILDLLAGPVFLFLFLWGLRSVDYTTFGLTSGKYNDTYGAGGAGYGNGVSGATGPGMTTRGAGAHGAIGATTGTAAPGVGDGSHAGGVGPHAGGVGPLGGGVGPLAGGVGNNGVGAGSNVV